MYHSFLLNVYTYTLNTRLVGGGRKEENLYLWGRLWAQGTLYLLFNDFLTKS